jgi:CheY-like chemotaxis protein
MIGTEENVRFLPCQIGSAIGALALQHVLTLRAFRTSKILNEIVVVRDGVKALDYLLGTPVLIVLDLHMPKMGGLALLRRLRAEEPTRRIPVLILSGSSDERDVVSSHDLGANRFIGKPLNVVQFAAAARQLGLHGLVAAVDDGTGGPRCAD